jgi:hypothetical protein
MSSFQPPRTVDDVEKPPPLDHGTTLCRGPFEDLGVDRVLFRHPGVELGRVAEPVLFVGAGPGHVPSSDIVISAMTFGIAGSSRRRSVVQAASYRRLIAAEQSFGGGIVWRSRRPGSGDVAGSAT